MANETYFKNFNTIKYGNNTVVDITERVVTLNNVQKNPYVYYPYDLLQGARADQISDQTYNDSYASWVLYLSNDITDPYYEWPLDDYQFNKFIEQKYGSMENALRKIAFWRNNWVGKEPISVAAYNSQISSNPLFRKYWKPNFNYGGGIINYSRTQEDWVVNTNKIFKYDIDTTGLIPVKTVNIVVSNNVVVQNEYFTRNEIVTINDGTAQVLQSNSTVLMVNHPRDITDTTQTGTIIGKESNNTADFNQCIGITNTISDDEIVYWSPVSYYDVENEKNMGNRTIRIMQPQYVPKYIYNVKTLLSNT
jgi:hypothetical protein